MMPYELPAAIEQAIATFRGRHEDVPLYLKADDDGFCIRFKDPDSGFLSTVYIFYDVYREQDSYSKFEAELISLFEEMFDEMNDILEGKTCTEIVN